jgi:hypothetical protein
MLGSETFSPLRLDFALSPHFRRDRHDFFFPKINKAITKKLIKFGQHVASSESAGMEAPSF